MTQESQEPVVEVKLQGECLLIVGNAVGLDMLGNMLLGRKSGTAFAERALAGNGRGQMVCVLCCDGADMASVSHGDVRVQAALDDLFSYYTSKIQFPRANASGFHAMA